jgi:hypothetical protein
MKSFVDGDVVSCVATFADRDFKDLDPASVTFMYQIGTGTVTSVSFAGATTPSTGVVAKNDVGVYEFWIDTTGFPGSYTVQAKGTGQGQATTKKEYFNVSTRLA